MWTALAGAAASALSEKGGGMGGGTPGATGTFTQGGLNVGNYQAASDSGVSLDQNSVIALAVVGIVLGAVMLKKKG